MTDRTEAMDNLIAQDADLIDGQPTQSDAMCPWTADTISIYQKGYNNGVEEAAKALEADAMKCDCAALEERECGCGAWDDYKSITSARAVEIVRALQEQSK